MTKQAVSGADVILLGPHERMTVEECLSHCAMDHAAFRDVIVVGYGAAGDVVIRSSGMTRAEAVFLLLKAIDHARGAS